MDSKGLRDSTQRRTTSIDASYKFGGPPDPIEAGHTTAIQRHFSIIPDGATRAKATARPAAKGCQGQTINKSIRRICPFCQKEEWQTSDVYRLSSTQLPNNSEPLRITTNRRIVRPTTWRKSIFKTRSNKGILPDCDRPEGPLQNGV